MKVNKTVCSRFNQKKKKRSLRFLENQLKKFVDFNKNNRIFYDNLYLNNIKCVIKTPFPESGKKGLVNNIRIEKFDLTNSIYILNYD